MKKDENVFPEKSERQIGEIKEVFSTGGLSKREYFAAAAMSAISKETIRWSTQSEAPGEKHKNLMDHVAKNAVYLADALIKELEK